MVGSGGKGLGGGRGWGTPRAGAWERRKSRQGGERKHPSSSRSPLSPLSPRLGHWNGRVGTWPRALAPGRLGTAGDGSCHRGSRGPSLSLDTQQIRCCSVSQTLFRVGPSPPHLPAAQAAAGTRTPGLQPGLVLATVRPCPQDAPHAGRRTGRLELPEPRSPFAIKPKTWLKVPGLARHPGRCPTSPCVPGPAPDLTRASESSLVK